MSNTTAYLRMLGYSLTILMHVSNIVYINMGMKPELANDQRLKTFSTLQPRYFTVWTFLLQILHAWIGLVCDYLLLSNANNKLYKLAKRLKGFKDTMFSAVLWPCTWIVFSVFWPLYIYDRSLIFPDFIDKILTSVSNHIMHTFIVFVVLWELRFQPRLEPMTHKRNLSYLATHLLLYFALTIYTYVERGVWLYPIFAVVYGTIYFPVVFITIGAMAVTFYYTQWTMVNYYWPSGEKTQKIR